MAEADANPEPDLILDEPAPEPKEGEDDGLDDLEIGPEKYRVAKPIKEAWNGLQKSTQAEKEALKAERAGIEQERTKIAESQKIRDAFMDEVAEIKSVDKQLAKYADMDATKWLELKRSAPESYEEHWPYYQALKIQRDNAFTSAQEKARNMDAQQRQAMTEQQAAAEKELVAKFKDWSPEKKAALTRVAVDSGISEQQIAPFMSNAAVVSILDDAAKYRAAVARSDAAKAAAAKAAAAGSPEPEPQPKLRAPNSGSFTAAPRDSDDNATWLKKRQEQLRKAGKRI